MKGSKMTMEYHSLSQIRPNWTQIGPWRTQAILPIRRPMWQYCAVYFVCCISVTKIHLSIYLFASIAGHCTHILYSSSCKHHQVWHTQGVWTKKWNAIYPTVHCPGKDNYLMLQLDTDTKLLPKVKHFTCQMSEMKLLSCQNNELQQIFAAPGVI